VVFSATSSGFGNGYEAVRIRVNCINKDENSPSHVAADCGNNEILWQSCSSMGLILTVLVKTETVLYTLLLVLATVML
jgi:hypothetical protein